MYDLEYIKQWYAKNTNRIVEELDEIDLFICKVIQTFINEHKINKDE